MSNKNLAEGIQSAIRAHAKWKLNLQAAITVGHSKFNIRDVSCNNNCAFAKMATRSDLNLTPVYFFTRQPAGFRTFQSG